MKKPLDRREFLRGAGVALSLPFLEAMLPFGKSWAAEPMRFGVIYRGQGVVSSVGRFHVKGPGYSTGAEYQNVNKLWNPTIQGYFNGIPSTYIYGLQNIGTKGNHQTAPGFMANCLRNNYKQFETVDQIAAGILNPSSSKFKNGIYAATKYAAGLTQSETGTDISRRFSSISTIYSDPRLLFNALVGTGMVGGSPAPTTTTAPAAVNQQKALRRDVLSLAMDSIKSLQKELSAADKITLDRTLTTYREAEIALREVEASVPTAPVASSGSCSPLTGLKTSYENELPGVTLPLMADLLALAINCDITRTFTFSLMPDGNTEGHNTHKHLDATLGNPDLLFHAWSHSKWRGTGGDGPYDKCLSAMDIACKWEMRDVVARFLSKVDPAVMDASAFVLGSGNGFDSAHPNGPLHENVPFAVFGRLNGRITPQGTKVVRHTGADVGAAMLTILQKMGFKGDSFGEINPKKTIHIA